MRVGREHAVGKDMPDAGRQGEDRKVVPIAVAGKVSLVMGQWALMDQKSHQVVLRILGAAERCKLVHLVARINPKETAKGRAIIGKVGVALKGRPGEEHLRQRIVPCRRVLAVSLELHSTKACGKPQAIGKAVQLKFAAHKAEHTDCIALGLHQGARPMKAWQGLLEMGISVGRGIGHGGQGDPSLDQDPPRAKPSQHPEPIHEPYRASNQD